MINKIGIDNIRIFKDLTEFKLTPITLLTGANNSGKSSFLKTMNLLQQSVKDLNSLNVLKFDSGNHNLGSFKNTVNWQSNKDDITLEFDFPLDYFDEDFKLELVYREMGEVGYLKSYKIFNKHRNLLLIDDIELDYTDSNYQTFINSQSAFSYYFSFDLEYIKKFVFQEKIKNNTISDDLIKTANDFLFYTYRLKEKEEWVNININEFIDLRDDLLLVERTINQAKAPCDSFYLKSKNSDLFSDCFDDIDEPLYKWKDENYLGENLSEFFQSELLNRESEIDSFEKELYGYRKFNFFDDDISINIEPENLDIFRKLVIDNIQNGLDKLKYSLTNVDFISAQRGNSYGEIQEIAKAYNSAQLDTTHPFIIKSLELLSIKGALKIDRYKGRYTKVSLLHNDKNTDTTDLGYGYSQVIPILLKIVLSAELNEANEAAIENASFNKNFKPTIIIEEPEANLHPNLQSKLADIFVLAYKTFGTKFILETHSEYLIRKLQYLTAKNEITPQSTIIYYFNSDDNVSELETKVKSIEIARNGTLTDTFGEGFIDEAITLQFELSRLNQALYN
jgi:predicted ATPase